MDKAEHLFISYAGEDWVFADWLARKLALEGYAIWLDRLKLLGGESYPIDIDDAIKKRTFRLIALLSRHSIHKANPIKERTIALNIARQRNIDFLIPLNLDGLSPTELDWMTSDLTFIPFHRNWPSGLLQLVKKLESVDAPKPVSNGLRLAASTYKPRTSLSDKGEQLISNIMPSLAFPKHVFRYRLNKSIPKLEKAGIQRQWAFMSSGSKDVISFQPPPEDMESVKVVDSKRYSVDREKLEGINTQNVISALLSKSIRNEFLRLGCKQTADGRSQYFPSGLLKNDRIEFTSYTGRKSYVQVTGARTFRSAGQKTFYHYHLCPTFRIRQDLEIPFCLQLSPRLYIADNQGNPLPPRSALSRRKRVAKSWFNHQWLCRTLAIHTFLAKGEENIVIDYRLNGESIAFEGMLTCFVSFSIDEHRVPNEDDLINVTDNDILWEEED